MKGRWFRVGLLAIVATLVLSNSAMAGASPRPEVVMTGTTYAGDYVAAWVTVTNNPTGSGALRLGVLVCQANGKKCVKTTGLASQPATEGEHYLVGSGLSYSGFDCQVTVIVDLVNARGRVVVEEQSSTIMRQWACYTFPSP